MYVFMVLNKYICIHMCIRQAYMYILPTTFPKDLVSFGVTPAVFKRRRFTALVLILSHHFLRGANLVKVIAHCFLLHFFIKEVEQFFILFNWL